MAEPAQQLERARKPRKPKEPRPSVILQVETVTNPNRLSESFGRIGGNLGPNEVTAILIEADSGLPARLVDLTHEARQKDGHLQSILGIFELAIQALPWDCVAPPGDRGRKPKKRDQKIANFVKAAIRGCQGFPTLIAHHTGEARLFAHATSEIMWTKQAGHIVPQRFIHLSCRRFAFTEEEGRLVYVDRPGSRTGVDLVEAHPRKFIQSRRRVNGDVLVREGLCRCLVWEALFRNWDIRDWLQLAEMSWKPWRKGKYTKGKANTNDAAALKRILEGMTASGIAVHPDTVEIEVMWPQFSGSQRSSNHKELAEFMAREMSKAVLGSTDVVEPGENGSRAAVETRNGVRKELRDAEALALASDIKTFLVEPLVRMNFGTTATIPEFFFLTEDPKDVKAFSEMVKNLRDAGLRIPASYVYDQTGMPEPKEGEELLGDADKPEEGEEPPPNGNQQNKPQASEEEDADAAAA